MIPAHRVCTLRTAILSSSTKVRDVGRQLRSMHLKDGSMPRQKFVYDRSCADSTGAHASKCEPRAVCSQYSFGYSSCPSSWASISNAKAHITRKQTIANAVKSRMSAEIAV